jgi:hypothetical protein
MTTPKDEKGAEPAAWRYKTSRGTWRYIGPRGMDEHNARILKPEPLYSAPPTSGLDSAREAHFADLMDLHSACFKNEGEDADEALARMRGLLKERRAALSDMKGKPPHYGPGSGERPQGGIPVQDGG